MFCCALLCAHSSFAIISIGRREMVALLCLSSLCLVIVMWLFLTTPRVCLQFVIVLFPDHTHYFFLSISGPLSMWAIKHAFLSSAYFFSSKSIFEKKIFQEYYISVKQLKSRPGSTKYRTYLYPLQSLSTKDTSKQGKS